MTLCVKCNLRPPTEVEFKSDKLRGYCSVCILDAISRVPNPDCKYCLGAGGYDDCAGQMITCNCSILDGIDADHHA